MGKLTVFDRIRLFLKRVPLWWWITVGTAAFFAFMLIRVLSNYLEPLPLALVASHLYVFIGAYFGIINYKLRMRAHYNWIPEGEELPPITEPGDREAQGIWLYSESLGQTRGKYVFDDRYQVKWWSNDYMCWVNDVTHWCMDLIPAPPEGVRKKGA